MMYVPTFRRYVFSLSSGCLWLVHVGAAVIERRKYVANGGRFQEFWPIIAAHGARLKICPIFPCFSSGWLRSLFPSVTVDVVPHLNDFKRTREPNSLALKMEAARFSETSAQTHCPAWCKDP